MTDKIEWHPNGTDILQEMQDEISEAITDSLDVDWSASDGARAVMRIPAISLVPAMVQALREELAWHEDHDKAISKQPNANTGDNGWRRMEHQERASFIRAILSRIDGEDA